jgi:hypothetical protein
MIRKRLHIVFALVIGLVVGHLSNGPGDGVAGQGGQLAAHFKELKFTIPRPMGRDHDSFSPDIRIPAKDCPVRIELVISNIVEQGNLLAPIIIEGTVVLISATGNLYAQIGGPVAQHTGLARANAATDGVLLWDGQPINDLVIDVFVLEQPTSDNLFIRFNTNNPQAITTDQFNCCLHMWF